MMAKIPCLARKCDDVLAATRTTFEASKTSLQAATGQERLHAALDHGAQRTRARLEALLIGVEVLLNYAVQGIVEVMLSGP